MYTTLLLYPWVHAINVLPLHCHLIRRLRLLRTSWFIPSPIPSSHNIKSACDSPEPEQRPLRSSPANLGLIVGRYIYPIQPSTPPCRVLRPPLTSRKCRREGQVAVSPGVGMENSRPASRVEEQRLPATTRCLFAIGVGGGRSLPSASMSTRQ